MQIQSQPQFSGLGKSAAKLVKKTAKEVLVKKLAQRAGHNPHAATVKSSLINQIIRKILK